MLKSDVVVVVIVMNVAVVVIRIVEIHLYMPKPTALHSKSNISKWIMLKENVKFHWNSYDNCIFTLNSMPQIFCTTKQREFFVVHSKRKLTFRRIRFANSTAEKYVTVISETVKNQTFNSKVTELKSLLLPCNFWLYLEICAKEMNTHTKQPHDTRRKHVQGFHCLLSNQMQKSTKNILLVDQKKTESLKHFDCLEKML